MKPGRTSRRLDQLRVAAAAVALSLVVAACVSVSQDERTSSAEPSAVPSAMLGSLAPTSVASEVPLVRASPGPSALATEVPPTAPPPTAPPRSAEPSIGYIALDESLPFVQAVSAGIREAATSAGIDLVECDSGFTADGVTECAEQLAQAGVHGLISFQPFAGLGADVCAITGDVPVVGVVFDQGDCQVSQLRIDQSASGRLAGEALGAFAMDRWACDINAYVSLESSDADPDGRARMQGYRDGFTAHCPLPERTLTLDGADRLVTAQTQVADLIEDLKGKPNLVVGLNEPAILGAMEAVSAAGRENHFWYSGQLADPAIREHIACDEHYVASVAQFPERFGEAVVPVLLDALRGRSVPDELAAELELVTSDNVRELFPGIPACGG